MTHQPGAPLSAGTARQIPICPLAGNIQSAHGAFHTAPNDAKTHRFPSENGRFFGASDLTRTGDLLMTIAREDMYRI